jgi:hypothetical protein
VVTVPRRSSANEFIEIDESASTPTTLSDDIDLMIFMRLPPITVR